MSGRDPDAEKTLANAGARAGAKIDEVVSRPVPLCPLHMLDPLFHVPLLDKSPPCSHRRRLF